MTHDPVGGGPRRQRSGHDVDTGRDPAPRDLVRGDGGDHPDRAGHVGAVQQRAPPHQGPLKCQPVKRATDHLIRGDRSLGACRADRRPAVRERGRTGEGFGRQGGETAARTGVVVALFGAGTLCGQLLASFCLGRCDRFRFLALASVLSGLAVCAAAVVGTGYAGLSALVCLLGVCLGGSMGSLQAVGALAYPATLRATGMGWMSGIGRIGTLVSGLFGGIMIGAGWEIPRILFVLCVPLVLTGVAALLLRGVLSRTAPPLPDR
ncbi:MFS transporter [Streptomyces lavendulae]|uniref:MFS transporter n=1 Tax=Streptomyces lavendulae TaxID=1914 RepID=UPI0036EC3A0B